MDRRKFLATVGVSTASIAGCTGGDQNTEGQQNTERAVDTQTEAPDTEEPPSEAAPSVTEVRFAEPRAIDIQHEQISGDTYEFTAEIQNSGEEGEIGATLVWLDESDDDVWGPNSYPEISRVRYFNGDERRSMTMQAEIPDNREGYGFRLWAGNFRVDVTNEGAAGRVDLLLMEGSSIVDERELLIEADETVTTEFSGDYSELNLEEFNFEARVSE